LVHVHPCVVGRVGLLGGLTVFVGDDVFRLRLRLAIEEAHERGAADWGQNLGLP
jgi:hypothetical protein